MSNATSSSAVVRIRDGASLIFNLPEYDVIDAVDLSTGGRRVVVQAVDRDDACPDCGVISTRVHQFFLRGRGGRCKRRSTPLR